MKHDPLRIAPEAATDAPASSPNPVRHDGFDAERKLLFLTALRQGTSVLHACALVGISNRTAYNHRHRDPAFAEAWRLARGACRLPLELVAYRRAVEGVEEQVWRHGKPSHVRTHYSDSLLRLLLAGEQPGKYGRRAALRPDREWLKDMVVDCIAGETAALRAALAAAQDQIAALKAQPQAPPAQIVNFVNRRVTHRRPANDAAGRESRHLSQPAAAAAEAASEPGNSPSHASAVNFADKGDGSKARHCEERSDEVIQQADASALDCFAPLAMTGNGAFRPPPLHRTNIRHGPRTGLQARP
jgi:hypothetical protein